MHLLESPWGEAPTPEINVRHGILAAVLEVHIQSSCE